MTDYEKAELVAVSGANCIPCGALSMPAADLAHAARIVAAVAFVRASGAGAMPVWPAAVDLAALDERPTAPVSA